MRLVIDLQGAQGVNRNRGIGRLTRALARAMIAASGRHEPIILLNDAIPESAEALSDEFSAMLPRGNIRFWRGLSGAAATGDARSLARRQAAELMRAQYIAGIGADAVHVSSVVEGGADDTITNWPRDLERPPHVATFYDVIPLIQSDKYLRGTWKHKAGWYLGQLREMRLFDGLLAISESSRGEAIDYLGFDPGRVFNMRAGFDSAMFRPTALEGEVRAAFLARHGLRDGYLLFVGAGDVRKNELGLLQAYLRLPHAMQMRHQLVIVGAGQTAVLQQVAASSGLQPDDLILLRHIPETELAALYSTCGLFIMPSEHEGFGLPVLEAMACGAPVLASNATSLPEVVGCEEALFDPHDPNSIAERIQAALGDVAFRHRLAEHGVRRAAEFTWEDSASRAWAALEALDVRYGWCSRQAQGTVPRRKPRLAFVSALPLSLPSAADNDRELLYQLARHYAVTVVARSKAANDDPHAGVFPTVLEGEFAQQAWSFDRILYRVGGVEGYRDILQLLLPRYPGVVILHDAYLGELHLADYHRTGDLDALARALFECHGWPAVAALHRDGIPESLHEFPCTLPVFRDALGVVQHSAASRDIACRAIGQPAADMVRLLPPVRRVMPGIGKIAARSVLGLDAEPSVVISIGSSMTPGKGRRIMLAWKLAMHAEPQARLAFVGAIPSDVAADLNAFAAQEGLADRFLVVERPDNTTYRLWLEAADIAVQTQPAWRGETHDAILDALATGVPVLAVGGRPELDLPPDAICALPCEALPSLVARTLGELWRNTARRQAQIAAGLDFVRAYLAPDVIVERYRATIEDAYSRHTAAHLQASLSALPEDDQAEAAFALVQNFQAPMPRRLLMDVRCAADPESAMHDLARHALAAPGDGWIADLVTVDGGVLRFARGIAATLLNLPLHDLPDPPVSGSAADTLVVSACAAADAVVLRGLRRRGVQVVAFLAREVESEPAEILAIADRILCASRALADSVLEWLTAGLIERRRPVDIGFVTGGVEDVLRALKSDQWEHHSSG